MEQKDQVKEQIKLIKKQLDSGKFHPSKGSLLGVESPALRQEIKETLRAHTLSEFLAKSGTTGIAGAAYLVPDKVHDDLIFFSQTTDKVPLISAAVLDGWKGGDLTVNIVDDESYKPRYFISGAKSSMEAPKTVQATISPKTFSLNTTITNDLAEDAVRGNSSGLIDVLLAGTARSIGRFATDAALAVLKTATDGVGTVNSSATGDADETRLVNGTTADIGDAVIAVGDDRFIANTMAITPSAWGHSVATQASEVGWAVSRGAGGYDVQLSDIDVIKSTSPQLHASTDLVGAAMTNCVTVVFDRNNALLTGRKRWMQIENFSHPTTDLAGAVITCRQDSVSLYDDSIFVLTET